MLMMREMKWVTTTVDSTVGWSSAQSQQQIGELKICEKADENIRLKNITS